jgi:hypothetical protein
MLMRNGILAAILCFVTATGAHAQCADLLEVQCIERAMYPGNVCLTLRLTSCSAPFRAFGVEIQFPAAYMNYAGVETEGTLTADWTEAGAALVSGSPERLRIGGYDAVGCGVQAAGALIRVCFELLAEVPSGSEIVVDESTMVDDLAGVQGIGCRMPSITPIEDSTWGRVKALFR